MDDTHLPLEAILCALRLGSDVTNCQSFCVLPVPPAIRPQCNHGYAASSQQTSGTCHKTPIAECLCPLPYRALHLDEFAKNLRVFFASWILEAIKGSPILKLATVQGCFVQAASPSIQTGHMAATTLELLKAEAVHSHPQPFVRRSALIAASSVSPILNPLPHTDPR